MKLNKYVGRSVDCQYILRWGGASGRDHYTTIVSNQAADSAPVSQLFAGNSEIPASSTIITSIVVDPAKLLSDFLMLL